METIQKFLKNSLIVVFEVIFVKVLSILTLYELCAVHTEGVQYLQATGVNYGLRVCSTGRGTPAVQVQYMLRTRCAVHAEDQMCSTG